MHMWFFFYTDFCSNQWCLTCFAHWSWHRRFGEDHWRWGTSDHTHRHHPLPLRAWCTHFVLRHHRGGCYCRGILLLIFVAFFVRYIRIIFCYYLLLYRYYIGITNSCYRLRRRMSTYTCMDVVEFKHARIARRNLQSKFNAQECWKLNFLIYCDCRHCLYFV